LVSHLSWLFNLVSVVSKDMKDVGTPDAMIMAEDRRLWKGVVAAHAMSQEDMLLE